MSSTPTIENILRRPRVTEKATALSTITTGPIYTFEVPAGANKKLITQAVKTYYKVTPLKVNIVNLPRKTVFVRGRLGTKVGVKKALVFLKKGDSIDFV